MQYIQYYELFTIVYIIHFSLQFIFLLMCVKVFSMITEWRLENYSPTGS